MGEHVNYLILEHIDPSRNMARFYVLSIDPTLFGDVSLTREWGRIGSNGRRIVQLFESRAEAIETLEHWFNRKVRRGYTVRP